MQRISTSEIAEALVSEISTDASHFRKEEDRLYLSGIEIALIIATGALNSFVLGLFEGARKGIQKQGEELARHLVEGLISRLKAIGSKIVHIEAKKGDEVLGELKKIQTEIDDVINESAVRKETTRLLQDQQARALDEMKDFLKKVGYPQDTIQERAEQLVARLLSEWPKD
jgi:hypothetical protein